MDGHENEDMGFQHGSEGILNCQSSGMSTNPLPEKVSGMTMSSVSMYKPSNGADPFFGSGWDPLVSLSQSENFGGSSMVSHGEYPPYPVVMENQGISTTSHLVQYPSSSSFVELVPKLPCFGMSSAPPPARVQNQSGSIMGAIGASIADGEDNSKPKK
ncbi:transcription factor bHLH74, partial [Fagus crenata]